jgi:hypothetical protein
MFCVTNPEARAVLCLPGIAVAANAVCLLLPVTAAEPLDEPPERLRDEVERVGLDDEAFVTLQHGGMIQTASGRVLNKLATLPLTSVKS